jgi:hypothetical protein
MKKKREKLFSKIFLLTLTVLIVLGFTIPGFLNPVEDQQQYVEPRLCNTDADCYLLCDDIPQESFCLQNLCQKNVCDEQTLYEYTKSPISFTLEVKVNNSFLDFAELHDPKNFFVEFSGTMVKIFSENLQLDEILEKVGISFTSSCIYVGEDSYCSIDDMELAFLVNNEENYDYANYLPQSGDVVEIIHRKKLVKKTVKNSTEENKPTPYSVISNPLTT